jgi:hypothetical protein
MNQNNPLSKFFRQPKIYITLPSRGLYYEPGVLGGSYENVPIFAMTGMDEISVRLLMHCLQVKQRQKLLKVAVLLLKTQN